MIRLALCLCMVFALGCGGDNSVSAPEQTVERPDDLMVEGSSGGGESSSEDDSGGESTSVELKL